MNVLVIDDHPLYRAGVVYQLQASDARIVVHEAASVEAGLALLEAGFPVELMLLDLHLPGYTGLAALKEIRFKRPEVPVLVLSGQEDAQLVRDCVEFGAFGFLPKSAPASTLHPALKLVLGGGVFLPASSLSVVRDDSPRAPRAEAWSLLGAHLTTRQREVLLKVAQGKPNKVIAKELGVSDATVKTHVKSIFNALALSNRTQAVYALARAGITVRELGLDR